MINAPQSRICLHSLLLELIVTRYFGGELYSRKNFGELITWVGI